MSVSVPFSRRRRRSKLARTLPFLIPGVVYVLVMFGYPIYDVVRMAFSQVNYNNFTTGAWRWIGFENFRQLPGIPGWSEMLRNTGIFLVASIVPQFVIGGLLAVVLREESRIRQIARSLVLLPWLFPAVATASVFLWMAQSPEGLFNSVFHSLHLTSKPPYWLDTPNDRAGGDHPGQHLDWHPVQLSRHPERVAEAIPATSMTRWSTAPPGSRNSCVSRCRCSARRCSPY